MTTPPAHAAALEHAARALGRLDAALRGHPLRRPFLWRFSLAMACRCAAADGYRIEPMRFAAIIAGLPLDADTLRRDAFIGRAYDALHWISILDADRRASPRPSPSGDLEDDEHRQRNRSDRARDLWRVRGTLRSLRLAGHPDNAGLCRLAEGTWRVLQEEGGRGFLRAALPRALRDAGSTLLIVPGLSGAKALTREIPDPLVWIPAFLHALADEADEGVEMLWGLNRHWNKARRAVTALHGEGRIRSNSRLGLAINALAAHPLVGAARLGATLGITTRGASLLLEQLAELELVVEVTKRQSHKLYGWPDLVRMADEAAPDRRFRRLPARLDEPDIPEPSAAPAKARREGRLLDHLGPLPSFKDLDDAQADLDEATARSRKLLASLSADRADPLQSDRNEQD